MVGVGDINEMIARYNLEVQDSTLRNVWHKKDVLNLSGLERTCVSRISFQKGRSIWEFPARRSAIHPTLVARGG